jgi:hypothetical protein
MHDWTTLVWTLALAGLLLLGGCSSWEDDDDDYGDDDAAGDDDSAADDDDTGDDDTGDDDTGDDDTGDDDTGDDDTTAAEVPLEGWGEISGDCGVLDDGEWLVVDPFLFRNAIDFGSDEFEQTLLTAGGQEIIDDGNLGGSSIHSEAIAFEVLYRCELASLVATETEISYLDDGGKKTDILVEIDGRSVGVSVTRAYHWPPGDPYTVEEAEVLLDDKLSDVILSEANADPANAWERSVLHVVAYDHQYADSVETAFSQLDAAVVDRTILILTVSDGEDEFLY